MGEAPKLLYVNGFPKYGHDEIDHHLTNNYDHDIAWYEEVIDDDLKWSFALNRFINSLPQPQHNSQVNYI